MPEFKSLILSIGGLQGFVLFLLLVSDKRVNYASKLLGLLCLLIATSFILPMIVAQSLDQQTSGFEWLIGPFLFLPASFGALTYLYCRTAVTGLPLTLKDALHLIPLLLCYLLNADIVISGEKALAFVQSSEPELLRQQLTTYVFYGQAVGYSFVLLVMVLRWQETAKSHLSSYNPNIFNWLWSIALFTVSIWALKILHYFLQLGAAVNGLADLLLVIMVYFIAIVHWRNPSLFHIDHMDSAGDSGGNQAVKEGSLDEAMRHQILELAEKKVQDDVLFKDSQLTLSLLAAKVGVSVHQLSETINQYGGKNFNQFINEYRVAEVCRRFTEQPDSNLLNLALESGFSSKSSFNATFKKLTGQTPSQCRSQLQTEK